MSKDAELLIFCENVKRLRKRERLSKKDMAKILHIGVKTLTTIEKGILPSCLGCSVLFYIDKHFGISAKDMFLNLIQIEK